MRKITAGLFISLDGVVERPDTWHFPYFNDEMGAAVGAQIAENDTMLLGRNTYESFAATWGHRGSDVPFADEINATTKLVVSSTLRAVEWRNSTLVVGDLRTELEQLKQQPGRNIGVTGSITLIRSLLALGLLDELRLMIHPIVVGKGMRLFEDGVGPYPLAVAHSETFRTGVLNVTYVPAGKDDDGSE